MSIRYGQPYYFEINKESFEFFWNLTRKSAKGDETSYFAIQRNKHSLKTHLQILLWHESHNKSLKKISTHTIYFQIIQMFHQL